MTFMISLRPALAHALFRHGVRVAPWLLVAALGCGGQAAPASSPSGSEAAPASSGAPAEAGPINWDAMDKSARSKYMKDVVLPKMKEHFVAFDSAKYGDMKCMTCHGPTAMHGTFEMPNPDLPKLPADPEKFKAWEAQSPKMAEFMAKVVKPEMAKLLNEPEYDPATNKGFGCGECHTTDK